MEYWSYGVLEQWAHWIIGLMECWIIELMDYWIIAFIDPSLHTPLIHYSIDPFIHQSITLFFVGLLVGRLVHFLRRGWRKIAQGASLFLSPSQHARHVFLTVDSATHLTVTHIFTGKPSMGVACVTIWL
jgi:hypothetical protein